MGRAIKCSACMLEGKVCHNNQGCCDECQETTMLCIFPHLTLNEHRLKTDGVASFIVEESFILQNKAANIKWKRDCWKLTASVISKRSILKIDDDDGALVDVFLRTLNWTGDNHLHLSLIPQILKSGINLKMNAIAYKFASLKRKRDEEDKEVHEEGAKGDRDENPQKKKKQED